MGQIFFSPKLNQELAFWYQVMFLHFMPLTESWGLKMIFRC